MFPKLSIAAATLLFVGALAQVNAATDESTSAPAAEATPDSLLISGESPKDNGTSAAETGEGLTDGEIRLLDAYEHAKVQDEKIVQLRELDAQIAHELNQGETSRVMEWRRQRRSILTTREMRDVLGALRAEGKPTAGAQTVDQPTTQSADEKLTTSSVSSGNGPEAADQSPRKPRVGVDEIVPLIPRGPTYTSEESPAIPPAKPRFRDGTPSQSTSSIQSSSETH